MINRRIQFTIFVVWFLVIMILSVIPDNTPDYVRLDVYEFRIDYLKHVLVFLPLGFLLHSLPRMAHILVILISAFVIAIPEAVQYFLSYRTFNPMDMVSNGIGFIFGIFFRKYTNRKYVKYQT